MLVNQMVMAKPVTKTGGTMDNITQTGADSLADLMEAKLQAASDCFIKTRSYDFVKETLEDQGHALICGPPGSGKTTLSLVLMDDYRKNHQHEVHLIRELAESEFLKQMKTTQHTLVVFDDIFGQFAPTASGFLSYRHLFDDFKAHFRGESEDHRLKVLFSTRTNVYRHIAPMIKEYESSVFKSSTVIDLIKDFSLSTEEKKQMICKHICKHGIELSQSDVDEIAGIDYKTLGFPYICELFTQQHKHITKSALDFFKGPLSYLENVIGKLFHLKESSLEAAVLVLMLCNDGIINLMDLQTSTTADAFKLLETIIGNLPSSKQLPNALIKAAKNMIGTYLTAEEDHLKFSHPTIYDAVACIVGQMNPSFILENCSLKFIVERVKLEDVIISEFDKYDLSVKLGRGYNEKLLTRLAKDTDEETLPLVLSHTSLHRPGIFQGLLAILQQGGKILHMRDKHNGRTFLFWAAFTGILKKDFFEIESMDYFEDSELLEACLGASMTGNKDALEYIMDNANSDLRSKIREYTVDDVTQDQGRMLPSHMCQPRFPKRHTAGQDLLIHRACIHGHRRVTEKLLQTGVDPNTAGAIGMSPLMYACYFGHLDIVRMLCRGKVADFSLQNYEADNCLHLAVKGGFKDVVTYLLKDVKMATNCRGRFDRTPLIYAAYDDNRDLVELLTENDAELEPKPTAVNRESALSEAAYHGSHNVVHFLLNTKQININLRGYFGRTALMMACRHGHVKTAKLLIQHNANTGLTDYTGVNCFHLIAMSGNVELLKWMKQHCRDTYDVASPGYKGRTPLMSAVRFGKKPMFDFLLTEVVDINRCDKDGETCLHYSAASGNPDIVQAVLDKGLDIEKTAFNGRTPIMYACQFSNLQVFSLLKSKGADINVKDNDGLGCLHLACIGGKEEIFRSMIELSLFEIHEESSCEIPLMRSACDGGSLEIVNKLLAVGLNPTPTCLHAACYRGHKEIVDKLLEMNVDITARDKFSRTPFMVACQGGNLQIAKILLEKSSQDLSDTDKFGNTCLHLAAKGNNPEIISWLAEMKASLSTENVNGRSALHFSCQNGAAKTTEILIHLKCPIDQKDNDGKTPLLLSLSKYHPRATNVVEILLENKADIRIKDNNGDSCMHIAARRDIHVHSIGLLLKAGMNIDERDKQNNSPIMIAARYGQENNFTFLLNRGADIENLNNYGASLLHLACSGKYPSVTIIKQLIDLGLDPHKRDKNGRTPPMSTHSLLDKGIRDNVLAALSSRNNP